MPHRSLILHTLVLGAVFAAAAAIQLVATLYWAHHDGIRWSIEQLTACELEIPEELREVVVEERRARIVPDTITRLIADLDFAQRSAPARATQRFIWLWLVPQAMEPEKMLGLYLRTWRHPEARGLCDAARTRFGRELRALGPQELRTLLREELREAA